MNDLLDAIVQTVFGMIGLFVSFTIFMAIMIAITFVRWKIRQWRQRRGKELPPWWY